MNAEERDRLDRALASFRNGGEHVKRVSFYAIDIEQFEKDDLIAVIRFMCWESENAQQERIRRTEEIRRRAIGL